MLNKISGYLICVSMILNLSGCGEERNKAVPPKTDIEERESGEESADERKAEVIAQYSTEIYDKEENRLNNIRLAAAAINGIQISAGEIFSFNDIVGERTAEKGYKEADLLVGKEKKRGIGGGVCQVSGTIYGAAQACGLETVERHKHEKEVAYARNGMDASVNYDNLDLKIRNTEDSDIKIFVWTDNEKVYAEIKKLK